MKGISYREFGRQLGVSGEAVRKAVNSGRIPPEAVGHNKLNGGRLRPCIADPDLARRGWSQTTDTTQHRSKKQMRDAGRKSAAARTGKPVTADIDPVSPDDDSIAGFGGDDADVQDGPSVAVSRKIEAEYKAKSAKLDYEERTKKLVNAEEIKKLFSQQITEAKTKIMAVGRQARSKLPHLTVDDVEVIEEICAEALEELSVESD